jgi:hypothetical protein
MAFNFGLFVTRVRARLFYCVLLMCRGKLGNYFRQHIDAFGE